MTAPFLEVENLHVHFAGRPRLLRPTMPTVKAVNGISFAIEPHRTFGLVGESGSGKSTVARAILQLTEVTAGIIRLDGADVTHVPREAELAFRKRVQAVLQDPYSSLNQVHQVRTIVGDGITRHFGIKPGPECEQRIIALLDEVGLTDEFWTAILRDVGRAAPARVDCPRAGRRTRSHHR